MERKSRKGVEGAGVRIGTKERVKKGEKDQGPQKQPFVDKLKVLWNKKRKGRKKTEG